MDYQMCDTLVQQSPGQIIPDQVQLTCLSFYTQLDIGESEP